MRDNLRGRWSKPTGTVLRAAACSRRGSSKPGSRTASCARHAGSSCISTPRSRSGPSSRASPATTGSCSCGARSNPATGSGCFRAGMSIGGKKSWRRRAARRARKPASRCGWTVSSTSTPTPGRPLVIIVYSATATGGELCTDEESPRSPAVSARGDSLDRAGFPQHTRRPAGLPHRADSPHPLIAVSGGSRRNWDQRCASSAANAAETAQFEMVYFWLPANRARATCARYFHPTGHCK